MGDELHGIYSNKPTRGCAEESTKGNIKKRFRGSVEGLAEEIKKRFAKGYIKGYINRYAEELTEALIRELKNILILYFL